MGVPSFFKQYGPRGFNYIPRHYDPDKEKREDRIRRIKLEMGIKDDESDDTYIPRIQRGSMSNFFQQKKRKVQKYTLIRLVVIILILVLISYVFLYT